MQTPQLFLLAMVLIFALPYLVWRIGRTEYYAPLVVVQIISGVLLGPGVLGSFYPQYYNFVFTPSVIGALNGIAWWAVILFVWLAGLELDLDEVWKDRSETALTAGFALGTPFLFGAAAALVMLRMPGTWIGPHASRSQFIAGIGMSCAVTALPILVLFLEKLGILRQPLGQRILRYASLDDVAIWGVLAVILLDWKRVGAQVAFLAGFILATLAVRRLLQRVPVSDRWYIGLIWLAACSFAADFAGLHFMVGAYLSGAVLDGHWFDRKRVEQLRETLLLTIMPVFFLSTGLKTKWDVHSGSVFLTAGLLLFASISGKLLGLDLVGRILRWSTRDRRIFGWLLQTKALIMIIFVDILLSKGIITGETFTALLLAAVGSTMVTIPMVAPKLAAEIATPHRDVLDRNPEQQPGGSFPIGADSWFSDRTQRDKAAG